MAKMEGCDDRQIKMAMAGDHHMREEGGASQRNTSLRVGCVVGGEDDLHSLPHVRHASVVAYSSCHKPSLRSLLTRTQYVTTLPWGKLGPVGIVC